MKEANSRSLQTLTQSKVSEGSRRQRASIRQRRASPIAGVLYLLIPSFRETRVRERGGVSPRPKTCRLVELHIKSVGTGPGHFPPVLVVAFALTRERARGDPSANVNHGVESEFGELAKNHLRKDGGARLTVFPFRLACFPSSSSSAALSGSTMCELAALLRFMCIHIRAHNQMWIV